MHAGTLLEFHFHCSSILFLWQTSTYEIDCYANPDHLNASLKNQLVKHEMALNILEIVGFNTSHAVVGGDQGFYVTYKFPVFDVTINKSGKGFISLLCILRNCA